ncbi:MAG: SAM-dependent methyltransferase [Roseburia sp.]|nr:SAM-dependent methyltransferase [Roseburia sp.]
MDEIKTYMERLLDSGCTRIILSKPASGAEYKKITVEEKAAFYQIEKLTEKQAFHENVQIEELLEKLTAWLSQSYRQLNGFGGGYESVLLISKKGKVTFKQKRSVLTPKLTGEHNRKKQYFLEEGEVIAPLVDMGIFTSEGKIIPSMYDKFRQINRFIEMVDDYVKTLSVKKLNIIDFGCGKSYLTFILYYYLTEKRNFEIQMIGLDLKADVIEKCNRAVLKYGYKGLRFEQGDIGGYQAPFEVDMAVSLHACDTATDFALYHAICWDAKMIFSVPCCQHELNGQMESEDLSLLTRYGIIQERFAALMTDSIRANLLECCGYKTQVLEFVDLSHTPKNLLIRGMKKKSVDETYREKILQETKRSMDAFHVRPTLYQLLKKDGHIDGDS